MKQYTQIPPTSDSDYWELKSQNRAARLKTFVPKDKELHHQLKAKAWKVIQASLPYKDRAGSRPAQHKVNAR